MCNKNSKYAKWLNHGIVLFCLVSIQIFYQGTSIGSPVSAPIDRSLTWTMERWTASDTPYLKVRQEVDAAISNGTNPDTVLQKAKANARQSPTNALSVFRWAYAAERAGAAQVRSAEKIQRWNGVYEAMAIPQSPHSYEYDRLRYLMTVRRSVGGGTSLAIYHLGKRLVQHSPNDWQIKERVASILSAIGNKNDRQIALKYAREVCHAQPQVCFNWATLGQAYFYARSTKANDKEYLKQSIAAYKKYLQVAPPEDDWRPTAKKNIHEYEKLLAE